MESYKELSFYLAIFYLCRYLCIGLLTLEETALLIIIALSSGLLAENFAPGKFYIVFY